MPRWRGAFVGAMLAASLLSVEVSAPAAGAASDAAQRPAQGGDGAADRAGRANRAGPSDQDLVAVTGDQHGAGPGQPARDLEPVLRRVGCARAERRNCEVTGTPEGRYPTSNYGFDVHIDTGLDNIVGNFQALLAQHRERDLARRCCSS